MNYALVIILACLIAGLIPFFVATVTVKFNYYILFFDSYILKKRLHTVCNLFLLCSI